MTFVSKSPTSAASGLTPVSSNEKLNQKVQIDASQRSLNANGFLKVKLDVVGISKQNLAKAISMAVQSGKVDLNVSPRLFNIQTDSQVGSDVLAVAKGLDIKTDKKSVKQLIAEIGAKSVDSKAGQVMLPTKLLNGLGAISLAAVASEGDGKLNALGIKAEREFKGGTAFIKLVGGEKTGLKGEFGVKLTKTSGNTSASFEGGANTQGGARAKVTVKTGTPGNSVKVDASVSSIQGEPKSKVELTSEGTIGKTPIQGSVNVTDSGKGAKVGGSVKIGPDNANVTAELNPGKPGERDEVVVKGGVSASF